MKEIQKRLFTWRLSNFGWPKQTRMLLGIMEELGEISHAWSKYEEKVRGYADFNKMKKEVYDGIGDLVIFTMGLCDSMGWDFETLVKEVAEKVLKRDWKKDPVNGGENGRGN